MPIRYYEGVEGSGKSVMMTRDLKLHHDSGGIVAAFPGYELYDGNGKTISELLLPEHWVNLPDSLRKKKLAIGIDEVTNWFNNHVWYNKICDMMGSLMAQRRKFELAILMTGPIMNRLPPVIREMVHECVHCQDRHTLNHSYPRGHYTVYYKEDLRGLLSNPKRRVSKKKIFYTKPWWPFYDTYKATDTMNQYINVKVKRKTIVLNQDGSVYSPDSFHADMSEVDRYTNASQIEPANPLKQMAIEVAKRIKQSGNNTVDGSVIFNALGGNKKVIGGVMSSIGATYNPFKKIYDISNVSIDQ